MQSSPDVDWLLIPSFTDLIMFLCSLYKIYNKVYNKMDITWPPLNLTASNLLHFHNISWYISTHSKFVQHINTDPDRINKWTFTKNKRPGGGGGAVYLLLFCYVSLYCIFSLLGKSYAWHSSNGSSKSSMLVLKVFEVSVYLHKDVSIICKYIINSR